MTNTEIIRKAESIIHDPERPEVLSLEDIGTISAALGIARILVRRTAEDDKAREEGRLVVLPEPRKPIVWGDYDHDTVLCPDCGKDLMGIPYGERMVLQCPECGQYLDATMENVLTRQEAEVALEGEQQ